MPGKLTVGIIASVMAISLDLAPSEAQTRLQKQFDKWLVACVDTEQGNKRCTMGQSFQGFNQKAKKRVFAFSATLFLDRDKVEKVILRTPMGVDLTKGLTVKFPDLDAVKLNYVVCARRGCVSEINLDDAWRNALSRNAAVTVSYKIRNGQDIGIEVDLKGFTDAYSFYKTQLGL
ncbi:MAG: invasion associated locus B family protein [Rhizobiaceae bacterium]|nr:invasion associated locus B family protein [Rhizobiaceae bacterium]